MVPLIQADSDSVSLPWKRGPGQSMGVRGLQEPPKSPFAVLPSTISGEAHPASCSRESPFLSESGSLGDSCGSPYMS